MYYCPYCNSQLEEGSIPFTAPYILNWISDSDKNKKVRVSDRFAFSNLFEPAKISGVYFCEKCNVIIKKI